MAVAPIDLPVAETRALGDRAEGNLLARIFQQQRDRRARDPIRSPAVNGELFHLQIHLSQPAPLSPRRPRESDSRGAGSWFEAILTVVMSAEAKAI